MGTYLLLWLILFGILLALLMRDRQRAGALSLSYFVALSLIHVPGGLAYLSAPWASEDTLRGLEVSVIGVAAYVAGVALAQLRSNRHARKTLGESDLDPEWLEEIARKFLFIGVFAFFVAIPVVSQIRSMTAVVSGFVGLLVIGVWLLLCAAIIRRNRRNQLLILGLLPLLPFATLTFSGFVSFSTQWIITILAFLFLMSRRKGVLVALMPIAFYLSLSLFVAYIGERNAIRDLVWEEDRTVTVGERLDRISQIFTNFELLDLDDPKHTHALDARLNQNFLVGAAVGNIESGSISYALGSTVPWWTFIPRVVWPDKPDVGGGGSIVSDYTGIVFEESTSVGAGQVLEFYVNFGIAGVVIGFFLWGFTLMTIDRRIMSAMLNADMPTLLRNSMVGLTLIAPGGNLIEIIVAAIGAFVSTPIVLYLDRKLKNLPLAVFSAKTKHLAADRAR